jgi:hypothetical protein
MAGIGSLPDFHDMWVGEDGLPYTADDIPTAADGNHFSTLGGAWFDLDGDGVQDFDTDNDGVFDTGNEIGSQVSTRLNGHADIPYSIIRDLRRGNGAKPLFSSSYPQYGQFIPENQNFRTHHAFHGNSFANNPPVGGSAEDVENYYADDANRNREFRYATRGHPTHQTGGNAPAPYFYNNDRANQWPWIEGSKYFYAHKNNLMTAGNPNYPKTPGNWTLRSGTADWVFADPDDVDYGYLAHPGGHIKTYDHDNEDSGGQGPYNCQNDHTRPLRAEVRGLLIPVADIAGLEDGSLTDPFGWAGEGFDMAAYVRDVLGPKLENPALGSLPEDDGCGLTSTNDLAGGPPTHIMIEQYQVNIAIMEAWHDYAWYPSVDGAPAHPRSHPSDPDDPNPGFGVWPIPDGHGVGNNCPLDGAFAASFHINKVAPRGTLVSNTVDGLPGVIGANVAETTFTGGTWDDCWNRGGDCATDAWFRYSHVYLIYNLEGISPTMDIGPQTEFETTPEDANPRNLWALDNFKRRGLKSQRTWIDDLSSLIGRYIRYPVEGDRTGDGRADDFTVRGTPYNCSTDSCATLIPPRSWGVTRGPTRITDGCLGSPHGVIYSCRQGSLELPFSGGVEISHDSVQVKNYRDGRNLGGQGISAVVFAYTGATAEDPRHVAMDTFYVAEELGGEGNPNPDLQVAVETGLGDLRTAWAPTTFPGEEHIVPPCGETLDPTDQEVPQPLEGDRAPAQQIILKYVPNATNGGGAGALLTGHGSLFNTPPGADELAVVWGEVSEAGSSINWGGTFNDRGVAVNPGATTGGAAPSIGDAEAELYTRHVLLFDGFRAQLFQAEDGIPEGDYVKTDYDFLGVPEAGYTLLAESQNPFRPFKRGDCNGDGQSDLSDGVTVLNVSFLGAATPGCVAACDFNSDGALDITNAVYLFQALFQGGPSVGGPNECASAPGPLTCMTFTPCE